MNRLVEIIGKAPSEMTDEELKHAITTERQRVSQALAELKAGDPKKTRLREEAD